MLLAECVCVCERGDITSINILKYKLSLLTTASEIVIIIVPFKKVNRWVISEYIVYRCILCSFMDSKLADRPKSLFWTLDAAVYYMAGVVCPDKVHLRLLVDLMNCGFGQTSALVDLSDTSSGKSVSAESCLQEWGSLDFWI